MIKKLFHSRFQGEVTYMSDAGSVLIYKCENKRSKRWLFTSPMTLCRSRHSTTLTSLPVSVVMMSLHLFDSAQLFSFIISVSTFLIFQHEIQWLVIALKSFWESFYHILFIAILHNFLYWWIINYIFIFAIKKYYIFKVEREFVLFLLL